jgi:hypothetical protein
MSNAITALTELALSVNKKETIAARFQQVGALGFGDPFLDELTGLQYIELEKDPLFTAAKTELEKDADLATLLPKKNQLDPMLSSDLAGGSRQDFNGVVTSLFNGAAKQIFVQASERSESVFVRAVLENYEELKRAVKGEQVRAYSVRGLAGITFEDDVQISTPWGVIRGSNSASPMLVPRFFSQPRVQTSALLITPQLVQVSISRENSPEPPKLDQKVVDEAQKIRTLTPLLFALSSPASNPAAPILTFETNILPFMSGSSFSSSHFLNPFIPNFIVNKRNVKKLEDLAKTISDGYHQSLQIASLRLVSAISQRNDRADSLIDAVTCWESLVGTRTESLYRVTAALTNLLELNPSKRAAFRKELEEIYNTRSRVVHGDTVSPQDIVNDSSRAIQIGIQAMLELYKRSGDWLSLKSKERSERLILGG